MTTATFTTASLAELLSAELRGPGDIVITGPNTMDLAGPGELTFIRSEVYARQWPTAKAGAALVSRGLDVPEFGGRRALLIVPDADLALIEVIRRFEPAPTPTPPGIHPTAVVDPTATLAPSVHVGPHCVIGKGCVLADGVVLHPGVILGADVNIGRGTLLHAHVAVLDRCTIGAGCIMHPGAVIGADGFGFRPSPDGRGVIKIPHAGHVEIHDGVEVGANTCVDRGKFGPTVIGAGTKIDNLVQIAHNVRIGRVCLIAGCAGIGGSVKVGDGVMIGGHAGIRDNVNIGAGAKIGAKAAVMRDVEPGSTVMGYPATDSRQFLREVSVLRRIADDKRKH